MWATLSETDRKAQRKAIASTLYKQGFTQEAIATQLGVSQYTISTDLVDLLVPNKSKSEKKTANNPKGSGRPKGRTQTKRRSAPSPDIEQKMARAHLDERKTLEQVADEYGATSVQHVKIAVAEERGARKAQPLITPDMLSMTAQQKFETWKRQEMARMAAQFNQMVLDKVREHMDEIMLPKWKQQIEQAKKFFSARRGIMDKTVFNKIRGSLHPDRIQFLKALIPQEKYQLLVRQHEEAFDLLNSFEKYLLTEKESPTEWPTLPSSLAEWDRMKEKATAARRAKRHGGNQVRPR